MVIEVTFMDLLGASIAIGAACYATWWVTVQREVRPLQLELWDARIQIASLSTSRITSDGSCVPLGDSFGAAIISRYRNERSTPPTLRTGASKDDDQCISSVDVAIADDGADPDTPSPASLADTVRPPSRR